MRKITDHQVNPANDKLQIAVTDEPGSGGANHRYEVRGFSLAGNPSSIEEDDFSGVLIAICIDRLRSFQAGPYACRENALALTKLEEAQMWLLSRTRARMARNVEGTHTV